MKHLTFIIVPGFTAQQELPRLKKGFGIEILFMIQRISCGVFGTCEIYHSLIDGIKYPIELVFLIKKTEVFVFAFDKDPTRWN